MSNKGYGYEKELEMLFDEHGAGLRIPASGSGTTKPLPDILGRIKEEYYGCELKFSSREYAQFEVEEIKQLIEFCESWRAQPLLVARFSYDTTFYYKRAEDINIPSDQESISIKKSNREVLENIKSLG